MSKDDSMYSKPVCLADIEQEGKKKLCRMSLNYYEGGADEEVSLEDNIEAFRR